MKIKMHICDICGKQLFSRYAPHPPIRIKMEEYDDEHVLFPWRKREICGDCAKKIYNYCIKEED